jgi:hypothetical protein
MSLFEKLWSKIRGHRPAAPAAPAARPPASPSVAIPAPQAAPAAPAPAAAAPAVVDVEAVLEDLAAKNPQKLDWRHSIVDLMKLVGMESSLAERKELAQELGYTGDTSDSASMNIWLHKQVLRKLAENGGQVPAALLD